MSSIKRIFFGANDAGGANAIAPVAAELANRGAIFKGFASGPARAIFTERGISSIDADLLSDVELDPAFDDFRPEIVLVGTSVGFTVEKRLTIRANARIVPSIAVLDFWSNYSLRFSKDKKDFAYLPTVVCVMDERARDEMVAEGFAPKRIAVTGNPHFDHFADGITRANEDSKEILFISQPLSEMRNFTDYGFDEFDAASDIAEAMQRVHGLHLNIRLHPKEDVHKYDKYLGENVSIADAALPAAISRAGLIIGIFSSVLIQAAAAGKYVISYEPGLIVEDPLATNRLGITKKVAAKADLEEVLKDYAANGPTPTMPDMGMLWPKGATERVAQIMNNMALRRNDA